LTHLLNGKPLHVLPFETGYLTLILGHLLLAVAREADSRQYSKLAAPSLQHLWANTQLMGQLAHVVSVKAHLDSFEFELSVKSSSYHCF